MLQERDGCINVLKSYKLDSGVDALLRENMNEVGEHSVLACIMTNRNIITRGDF